MCNIKEEESRSFNWCHGFDSLQGLVGSGVKLEGYLPQPLRAGAAERSSPPSPSASPSILRRRAAAHTSTGFSSGASAPLRSAEGEAEADAEHLMLEYGVMSGVTKSDAVSRGASLTSSRCSSHHLTNAHLSRTRTGSHARRASELPF